MKMKGAFLLEDWAYRKVYDGRPREDIERHVEIVTAPLTAKTWAERAGDLAEVETLFTGWGVPKMDDAFLAAVPKLKAVFHGAGSIRGFVTPAFWARGIRVTNAAMANSIPVAEYCLGVILLSLKRVFSIAWLGKSTDQAPENTYPIHGNYGSKVGIVTLGAISKHLLKLLQPFDLEVWVYSRSLTPEKAAALNVRRATVEEIFRACEVVSLHTPLMPATEGMITGAHLESMKPGATFINTARGALVKEDEMIEALRKRPDLQAVLDVTHPEPPVAGSPLYALPNVVYTPHIAGSIDRECLRLGQFMADEVALYAEGQPLKWEVTEEDAAKMA